MNHSYRLTTDKDPKPQTDTFEVRFVSDSKSVPRLSAPLRYYYFYYDIFRWATVKTRSYIIHIYIPYLYENLLSWTKAAGEKKIYRSRRQTSIFAQRKPSAAREDSQFSRGFNPVVSRVRSKNALVFEHQWRT